MRTAVKIESTGLLDGRIKNNTAHGIDRMK
jgi:hypothetical protein